MRRRRGRRGPAFFASRSERKLRALPKQELFLLLRSASARAHTHEPHAQIEPAGAHTQRHSNTSRPHARPRRSKRRSRRPDTPRPVWCARPQRCSRILDNCAETLISAGGARAVGSALRSGRRRHGVGAPVRIARHDAGRHHTDTTDGAQNSRAKRRSQRPLRLLHRRAPRVGRRRAARARSSSSAPSSPSPGRRRRSRQRSTRSDFAGLPLRAHCRPPSSAAPTAALREDGDSALNTLVAALAARPSARRGRLRRRARRAPGLWEHRGGSCFHAEEVIDSIYQ